MSGTFVLAVLLVGAAVYLAVRPAVGADRLAVLAERRAANRRSSAVQPDLARSADPPRSRLPVLSCALCGAVAVILIGGILGVVLGAAIVGIGPKLLGRLESRGDRAHREVLEVSAPTVADLMAACLASGTSTAAATRATAEAMGGPVADLLNECVVQFNLGASPARVWKPMSDEPSLAPIARAILRSAETGAPLTTVLLRVADDLRLVRRAHLDQAAKTVGIKAVGPLGLCFLPAFMLLGVVPLIASLISAGLSK